MTALVRDHAQEDLLKHGWALTRSGPKACETVRMAAAPALVPDPRGAGKHHARDVITYEWSPHLGPVLAEAGSIAHGAVDDFSRFHLLATDPGFAVAATVLGMIPPRLRHHAGRMSADFFHYGRSAGSEAHQDKFGDIVVIWVLGRDGLGGENFLTALDGREVFRGVLQPGEILIFRDEMFYHGVEPLLAGWRDALIFITLRD